MIIPNANLVIKDPTNGSRTFVNGQTISVSIESSPVVDGFLLSETITIAPAPNDPRFSIIPPTTLTLQSPINSLATTYLWLRSVSDDVNSVPTTASIFVLPETPTGTLNLRGIIESTGSLARDRAEVKILTSGGAEFYAISESPTLNPNAFAPSFPTTFIFASQQTNHTLHLWIKDKNGKINTTPIMANIFTPTDTLIAHRPHISFVDQNNQGPTSLSRTIRAVLGTGEYIEWTGIKFNPVGKNFSAFNFEITEKRIKITIPNFGDCSLLGLPSHWNSVSIHLKNFTKHNATISRNRSILYTNHHVRINSEISNVTISANEISFNVTALDGDTDIFDFVSDCANEVSFSVDDYDYAIIEPILKCNPAIAVNIGSISDTQLNAIEATQQNVKIEVSFSELNFRYYPGNCQVDVEISEEALERTRQIDILGDFVASTITDCNGDSQPLGNFNIKSIVVNPKNFDQNTTESIPDFEFEVLNALNTFAEFSIQLDTDPRFSNPTNLAFRVFESDSKITTIQGLDKNDVTFFDNSMAPLPYGTIYWRVARSGGPFSEPAEITVRNAPVFKLEFSVGSSFSREVGQTSIVKVRALDAWLNPIHGAKIKSDLTAGSANEFVNTNVNGLADITVEMPNTIQKFSIKSQSENRVISHEMDAIDPVHDISRITFDPVPNSPPVVRYLIFRNAFAEVEQATAEKLMLVSHTTSTSIVVTDETKPQLGVVFDPEHNNLRPGRDTSAPTPADQNILIQTSPENCSIKIRWGQSEERGTTWFYDGKAVSHQHALSPTFSTAAPGGNKFDILATRMADGLTVAPSSSDTHGQKHPAYVVERFTSHALPKQIEVPNSTTLSIVDTNDGNTFDEKPDDVSNTSISILGNAITIGWQNPSSNVVIPKNLAYRVKKLDLAGNTSISDLGIVHDHFNQCLVGVLITRRNSTRERTEHKKVTTLNAPIPLAHGSILVSTMRIKRSDGTIFVINQDYVINSIGDENQNIRSKITFLQTGIADESDDIEITYRYGRAMRFEDLPTLNDPSIAPFDGTFFSGPLNIDTASDTLHAHGALALTYGIWVRNFAGNYSNGQYLQLLIDPI